MPIGSARLATLYMGGGGAGGGGAPAPEGSWDLSTVSYNSKSFSVTSQESTPTSLFFKSDGTKMYIAGTTNDNVRQYSLSTAWDVTTSSYDSVTYSISGQEGGVTDIFFKSDGTKMYVLGINETVFQYSLSTAWVVSSASYDSVSFSVSDKESTLANGLYFSPDGTKMYVLGANSDSVHYYSLSTAWVVSSASFISSTSIFSQSANSHGIWFKPDGTRMYITGKDTNTIFQYSLSTAWATSTATYASQSYDATSQDGNPSQLYIKSDGLILYMMGNSSDTVYQYALT